MKNSKMTTTIIIFGIIILIVFTSIITINLMPDYESNSYFVKIDEVMSAKIESVDIVDGQLIINTTGEPTEYCVKRTKSTPALNAVCWNKVSNNKAQISIFEGKRYYIWIKDENNNISNYLIVNSNKKQEK